MPAPPFPPPPANADTIRPTPSIAVSHTGSPASPGEADVAPVVPAPALPVWPPPTNPGGRRDEPALISPALAPRPSSRPGLRPGSAGSLAGSAGSLAAVDGPGGDPGATRPQSSTAEPPAWVGTSATGSTPGVRSPGEKEQTDRPAKTERPAEVAPAQRPGGSDLSAYYAGLESSATVAFPAGEQETSGSLTGHILAQGWADTAAERSRSTLRVVILMAVALGVLVAISVMVVLFANDALPSASSGLPGDRQLSDRW